MISYVIASQRVRPEVAGPMTSSAKQSSAQCKRPLDCFVASAPRNDARFSFSRCDLHPSGGHASNEKPRKFSLSAPIFVRRHRRWWPAPSRSMLQATNVSVRRKRKAERRKTLIRILRAPTYPPPLAGVDELAPCKARSPIGVPPRLSPKGVIVPKAQLQARLPGTWSVRALPAFACPSPASTSRPGHNAGRLMPKPPGSGSDEPPPAGTASRSDQPGSPADVLHGERDWAPLFKSKHMMSKAFSICSNKSRACAARIFDSHALNGLHCHLKIRKIAIQP